MFGTTTIIEPFAGSLAYSLAYHPQRIVAAEANPKVRALWTWLRTKANALDIQKLETLKPKEKVDARDWGAQHDLTDAQVTLMRLQTSGAYVGQLSSWILYPQHSVALDGLVDALDFIKRVLRPVQADFRHPVIVAACAERGSFAFVDPPYLETSANYKADGKDHGGLDPRAVEDFVLSLPCPVLMTYGDGAQETFPRLTWKKAVDRKVPILRGGGTRLRTEWYSFRAP